MKKELEKLLSLTDIENVKEIQVKGNTYIFTHKNNGVVRGSGIYTAYNFRCQKESHTIILYVNNDVVCSSESLYSRS